MVASCSIMDPQIQIHYNELQIQNYGKLNYSIYNNVQEYCKSVHIIH